MSLAIKAARSGGRAYQPQVGGMRGDPGLFGAIGGFLKGAAGSLIGGGNPIAGGIRGAVSGWKGPTQPRMPAPPQIAAPPRGVNLPFRGARGAGVPSPVGRISVGEVQAGTKIACPSGFHANKSDYFLRDGTYVPKGSKCVKNRRRNPMNPRALDRAIGRMNSAKRLQSKLSGFSTKEYTAGGKRKAHTHR